MAAVGDADAFLRETIRDLQRDPRYNLRAQADTVFGTIQSVRNIDATLNILVLILLFAACFVVLVMIRRTADLSFQDKARCMIAFGLMGTVVWLEYGWLNE